MSPQVPNQLLTSSLFLATGFFLWGIALWVYHNQTDRSSLPFVGVVASSAGWSTFYGLEILVTSQDLAIIFAKLVQVSIISLVMFWVVFAIGYSKFSSIWTLPTKALVFIPGIIFLAGVLFNEQHWMYWFDYAPAPGSGGIPDLQRGPLYWVAWVWIYTMVASGHGILFRYSMGATDFHKRNIRYLLWATGAVVIVKVLTHFEVLRTTIDLTSLVLALAGVVSVWAIYRHRFFDLSPVARERVVHNISDATLILDKDGNITDLNPAAEDLVPSREDALGQPAEKVLPQTIVSRIRHPDDTRATDGGVQEPATQRAQNIRLDVGGQERYYDINISPVAIDDMHMGEAVLLRDITALKHKQEQLERQNERLDQFASVVSHDLRNPLEIADGFLDVYADTQDEEHFEKVSEAHSRMFDMIDDILTLARQGGDLDLSTDVPVGTVAQQAWSNVETQDASLSVGCDLTVRADRTRLMNVFENLFRNAVEHGGHDVKVTIGELDSRPGFFVEDDGEGIPSEDYDAIFEQGFSSNDGGTGIGLAIVHQAIRDHGWEIIAVDGADGGARFEIAFSEDEENRSHDHDDLV